MEQKWSAVVLPAALAALVLCAGVLAACARAAAEESAPVVTSEVAPITAAASDAPPEVYAPRGTPAEAAGQFASALVAGDLATATRSFAPAGLTAARALVNQKRTTDLSQFYSATIQSMDAGADGTRWEIVFAISSSRGESRLWTRWEWFELVGWRIAALAPLA